MGVAANELAALSVKKSDLSESELKTTLQMAIDEMIFALGEGK